MERKAHAASLTCNGSTSGAQTGNVGAVTVRNLTTLVDYATWTLALAALPNPLVADVVLEDQNAATYAETVTVGVAAGGFTLTLRGRTWATRPTINAGGLLLGIDVTAGKVVLQNLEIRNAVGTGLRLMGGAGHVVDRVKSYNSAGWALWIENCDVSVRNALLHRGGGGGTGVVLLNGTVDGTSITHTTIDGTPGGAFSALEWTLTGGTRVVTLRNNIYRMYTVAGQYVYDFNGSVASRDALVSDYNYFAPSGGPLADAGGPYANLAAWQATGKDAHSVEQTGADPLAEGIFVNQGAEDYHLVVGTRARDAGDPADTEVLDLDGNGRPVGVATDLGCFEYGSTGPIITVALTASSAVVNAPTVVAAALLLSPSSGPVVGGDVLVAAVAGANVLDTSRDDTLRTGVGWTAAGRVVADVDGVRLDAGAGTASLTSPHVWQDFDIRVVVVRVDGGLAGPDCTLCRLAVTVGADVAWVGLVGSTAVARAGRVTVGGTVVGRGVLTGAGLRGGRGTVLRLVRAGGHVWGLVDDVVVLDRSPLPTGNGTVVVAAVGASGAPVRAQVRDFTVQSGLLVDDQLVVDAAALGLRRLTGTVPATSPARAGLRNAEAFGLFGRVGQVGAFTYTLPAGRAAGPLSWLADV